MVAASEFARLGQCLDALARLKVAPGSELQSGDIWRACSLEGAAGAPHARDVAAAAVLEAAMLPLIEAIAQAFAALPHDDVGVRPALDKATVARPTVASATAAVQ